MKYSLVHFQDGRKPKCLVLTKDINGFEPMSYNDITDNEFLVKWQPSFHGDEEDHDGCYPAKVLLVGATPEEIRQKAKEMKIRLPTSFPPPEADKESTNKPMKEPLRKSKRKSEMETHQSQAKRKRMEDTLKCLDGALEKGKNEEVAGSSIAKSSCSPRSVQKARPGKNGNTKKLSDTLQQYHTDTVKSSKAIDSDSDASSMLEDSSRKNISGKLSQKSPEANKADEAKSPKKSKLVSIKNLFTMNKEESYLRKESAEGNNSSISSQSSGISEVESGKDANSKQSTNRSTLIINNCNSAAEETEIYKQKWDNNENNVIDETQNGNRSTGISLPKKSAFDGSASGDDYESDDNDEDDATVLLDQLKKQHRNCSVQIQDLEGKIEKLESDLSLYKLELTWKREMVMNLKNEIEELKLLNLDLQRQLRKQKSSVMPSFSSSPLKKETACAPIATSAEKILKKSPITGDLGSKKITPQSSPEGYVRQSTEGPEGHEVVSKKTVKNVRKNLDKMLGNDDNDNNSDEEEEDAADISSHSKSNKDSFGDISMKICQDLKGEKPLPGDANEVFVGMGLKINRKTWEKTLRTRKDDSKFYKDCAGIIWGREALQTRTAQRATAGKKPCTPRKVKLLDAMLKGKMMARGEVDQQQKFIVTNMAPKWLTDKCYDSGRAPKNSKKS